MTDARWGNLIGSEKAAIDTPALLIDLDKMERNIATLREKLAPTGVASRPRRVDTRRYLAWTAGRLAFLDAPLQDVLPDLARWYDVDFTLAAPSLAGRRLTLSVRGEPVTQVLDAIALLTHARYEQVGRSVTFYPTRAER